MKKRYIRWSEVFDLVTRLADRIEEDMSLGNINIIDMYAIPRGGCVVGALLGYILNLPLLDDETQITKNTIIIDEICDKGDTLMKYSGNVTCVLHRKTCSSFTPDYIGEEVDGDVWLTYGWELKDAEM